MLQIGEHDAAWVCAVLRGARRRDARAQIRRRPRGRVLHVREAGSRPARRRHGALPDAGDDDEDDEEEEEEEEEGEEAEEAEEEEEEDEEDEEGMEEEKEEEKAAPVPRGSGGGDGEALRKLMAAAKLRPRDATTYTSLARAVGRAVATKGAAASPSLKDFAIRSWKLAVQLAPARPSALRELAAALRAQGKEQAAERILARVAA